MTLNAHWSWPSAWSMNVNVRREGETWAVCQQDTYTAITTDELITLIDDVVRTAFGR